MKKHSYVLGTGLSHNGSACLLKDGKIAVAIEKERITRLKHDGGNDTAAILYCLEAEGITLNDVDLVVQNANFSNLKFGNDFFEGKRLFTDDINVPVVTISHHLAHAYSVIGTCQFDEFDILIIDGCGSSFDDCTDLQNAKVLGSESIPKDLQHLFCEKDSYYHYGNGGCTTLVKDFSEFGYFMKEYPMHPPTTKHSIGGVYMAVSGYVFGNFDDVGKLMGLSPYGRPDVYNDEIFEYRDGRVFVNYDWMGKFRRASQSYTEFKSNFQYYADIAWWIQRQVEKAVLYVVSHRTRLNDCKKLCYAGGVALNAVANQKILLNTSVKDIYMQPAAGDNGLAIGCAYYGWLEVLKKERVHHCGSTFFGVEYQKENIFEALEKSIVVKEPTDIAKSIRFFFEDICTRKAAFPKDHKGYTSIQFDIKDAGVYQVLVNETEALCFNEINVSPDCKITADADVFLDSLLDPSTMQTANIAVSNVESLEVFYNVVDLGEASKRLANYIRSNKWNVEVKVKECDDIVQQTAKLLADGKVIGWFQDKSEFGPRALGRRSILADPRRPDVRNFINLKIKLREDFRPFAPSVLDEDQGKYFEYDYESPYMILVNKVRDEWRDTIRSVVHEDDSARVHTVKKDTNPRYYDLLNEFKKQTGMSVLLNTSFNKRGMPIVEKPKDAIDFYLKSDLDYLVIDDFIVSR
jgi:predicted NodU family carbamoyl transferase